MKFSEIIARVSWRFYTLWAACCQKGCSTASIDLKTAQPHAQPRLHRTSMLDAHPS